MKDIEDLSKLIDRKFTKPILIELLECFKTRNDARIEELVTDEADIPTIFEYILAIIWFKVSEKRGNILEFMKLSLELIYCQNPICRWTCRYCI